MFTRPSFYNAETDRCLVTNELSGIIISTASGDTHDMHVYIFGEIS